MPKVVLSRKRRLIALLGLALLTGGCVSLLPTTISTELESKTPLRGTPSEARRIAIVPPSSLEASFNVPDPSRGRLDKVGLALAERLERSGRFAIVSPVQYQEALARERAGIDVRMTGAPTERERRTAILAAARQAGADAVLYLDGTWESALVRWSVKSFSRPQFRRLLTARLVSARSGETVWYQEATVIIREGLTTPQEDAVRETAASDLADNLLETMR